MTDDWKKEHIKYLDVPSLSYGSSVELLNLTDFTEQEIQDFKKYGFWMLALTHGDLQCQTDAQKKFHDVAHGKADASTYFERLYARLVAAAASYDQERMHKEKSVRDRIRKKFNLEVDGTNEEATRSSILAEIYESWRESWRKFRRSESFRRQASERDGKHRQLEDDRYQRLLEEEKERLSEPLHAPSHKPPSPWRDENWDGMSQW